MNINKHYIIDINNEELKLIWNTITGLKKNIPHFDRLKYRWQLFIDQPFRLLLVERQLLMEALDGKVDVKVQAADQEKHKGMGNEARCWTRNFPALEPPGDFPTIVSKGLVLVSICCSTFRFLAEWEDHFLSFTL